MVRVGWGSRCGLGLCAKLMERCSDGVEHQGAEEKPFMGYAIRESLCPFWKPAPVASGSPFSATSEVRLRNLGWKGGLRECNGVAGPS